MEIVVSTSPGREGWLRQCLESVGRECLVVSSNQFELGAISWVFQNTKIQRFLYLQDSVEIKSEKFFEVLDRSQGPVSVGNFPLPFGSYLGVYDRRLLKKVGVPVPKNKGDAVYYEVAWIRNYLLAAGRTQVMYGDLQDSTSFMEVFGQRRMVIENPHFRKFKGTWNRSQVPDRMRSLPRLSKKNSAKLKNIVESAVVLEPFIERPAS